MSLTEKAAALFHRHRTRVFRSLRRAAGSDDVAEGPLAGGLTLRDKKLRLDLGEFFSGSRVSLGMTVERIR